MEELLNRIWAKLPPTPLCFMGMGIVRVWTGTVNDSLTFPHQIANSYLIFDLVCAAVLIALATLSRRIAPLHGKPGIVPVAGGCMIACACINFASALGGAVPLPLTLAAIVLGATGIALVLMLWSEFFGCINPLRVALYYSASVIVSVILTWMFKGFALPWLWIATCLVPIVALGCLWRAYATLPENEHPHASWGQFSFPWKPVLVVGLYSFAFGLHESIFVGYLSTISSSFGDLIAAGFVYAGIAFWREKFQFSSIWKLALPLMLVSLIPHDAALGAKISDACATASYGLYTILIVVILSNLSYRYGVCALWIFAIERAARLVAVQAGLAAKPVLGMFVSAQAVDAVLTLGIAAAIVAATVFFFSEAQLSSPWGIILKRPLSQDREFYLEKNRLGIKCREVAKGYGLTAREEEILLLLAMGKKPASIERELYVAKSTIKTHIKHIYQKMNVHSRTELLERMGIAPKDI